MNALTIPPISGAPVVGFVPGGVGWSFTPSIDILVSGIEAGSPQVSFWQGSNQIISTFNIASPSSVPANTFESIPPLELYAGQIYYISCQNSNFSESVPVTVWELQGSNSNTPIPFTISSYITQYSCSIVSQDGQWSPPNITSADNNTLLYGPNFQFQVVPEPSSAELSLLVSLFFSILIRRRVNGGK